MLEEILFDKNFNEIIINKEYIEPLEILLQKERIIYSSLRRLQLDFKNEVTKEGFPKILKEVKDYVDKELDVTAPEPGYNYHSRFNNIKFWALLTYSSVVLPITWKVCIANPHPITVIPTTMMTLACAGLMALFGLKGNNDCYDGLFKKLRINKETEVYLKPVIAHEYAHYLQDIQFDYKTKRVNSAIEGHARGVQRIVSERYFEQENNPAYLHHITCETAFELADVYVWVSKRLGRNPRSGLIRNPYKARKPGSHAIGNATFYVLEQFHGRDIYKRFLQRDLKFLEGA